MKEFLIDTAERCLRTFAQTLAGFLTVQGATLGQVDWWTAISVSTLATIYCGLNAVATRRIGSDTDTGSVL